MGYNPRKPHAKILSKLAKKSLRLLRGFVFFVGKPLFLLIVITIEIVNFLFSFFELIIPNIFSRKFRYIFVFVFFFSFLLLFHSIILKDLPSPKSLASDPPHLSTKIYDRNGNLLYKIYEDEDRSLVKLSEIPNHTILATLAIEDNEFYKHPGFSVKGILRAMYKNIQERKLYGGSTITQQLIKNTLLTPEKNIQRKIKELILAVEVELLYSKNEILEMYMNNSPYGGVVYGIREAASSYFHKNVSDLTLAESAFLAGIPKSPTNYSPFIGDSQKSVARQKEVLDLMLSNGYISFADYNNALAEKLVFAQNQKNIFAPHFVMYVKEILTREYGIDYTTKGGLEVTTSLDFEIQKAVENVISEELTKLKNYNVTNAGVIVVDPKTGEILAMVGSKDYFDIGNDGNVNTLFSLRPPGSTIKVVNYSYALANGYTLASIINDSPVVYRFQNSQSYSPVNYDKTYKGNISVRSALAQSRNVPAVKILNSYGVEKMISTGQALGIKSWTDTKNYGLSMTLGGANTTLYDLAQVYSVLANYGVKKDLNPIISIKDYNFIALTNNICSASENVPASAIFPTVMENRGKSKNIISELLSGSLVNSLNASFSADQENKVERNCSGAKVMDPRIAFLITNVLSDNNARTPTFGARSQLNILDHKEVAVKTGTSNSMRDNIAIGYNRDYLVAVWVGNNDNSPMNKIASGITGATPIFNRIMTQLLKDKESVTWEVPKGLVKKPVCVNYKKPDSDEYTTFKYEEWFLEENIPKNICKTFK